MSEATKPHTCLRLKEFESTMESHPGPWRLVSATSDTPRKVILRTPQALGPTLGGKTLLKAPASDISANSGTKELRADLELSHQLETRKPLATKTSRLRLLQAYILQLSRWNADCNELPIPTIRVKRFMASPQKDGHACSVG